MTIAADFRTFDEQRSLVRAWPLWDLEVNRGAVDYPVRGICKLDQYTMRSGCQTLYDQRLAACIHPVPRRVINCDVYVTDTRRYVEGGRAKDGNDAEIVGAVRDDNKASRERVGERRPDDETRRFLRYRCGDARQVELGTDVLMR
jgi:hypothetical protein